MCVAEACLSTGQEEEGEPSTVGNSGGSEPGSRAEKRARRPTLERTLQRGESRSPPLALSYDRTERAKRVRMADTGADGAAHGDSSAPPQLGTTRRATSRHRFASIVGDDDATLATKRLFNAFDVNADGLAAGMSKISANLDKGVARGKVEAADRDAALGRLSAHTSLADAVHDAELVIEAVPEKLALKRSVFSSVVEHAPPTAILGTNTSSLSIADVADGLPHPDRVIGMHLKERYRMITLGARRRSKPLEAAPARRTAHAARVARRAAPVARWRLRQRASLAGGPHVRPHVQPSAHQRGR